MQNARIQPISKSDTNQIQQKMDLLKKTNPKLEADRILWKIA